MFLLIQQKQKMSVLEKYHFFKLLFGGLIFIGFISNRDFFLPACKKLYLLLRHFGTNCVSYFIRFEQIHKNKTVKKVIIFYYSLLGLTYTSLGLWTTTL